MRTENFVTQTRRLALGMTGLVCVGFALLVLSGAQEWRALAFVPGVVGVVAGLSLFVVAQIAGGRIARAVWDEMSRSEWSAAIRFGYWIALGMYPVFGFACWVGWVDFRQAFAAMGATTGGLPLLFYCWLDWRGR